MGNYGSEPIQFVDVRKPTTTIPNVSRCEKPMDDALLRCTQAMKMERPGEFLQHLMLGGTVLQVPGAVKSNMNFFFYAHRALLSHRSSEVSVVKNIIHDGFEYFKPNVCITAITPFYFNYKETSVICVHYDGAPDKNGTSQNLYVLWIPDPVAANADANANKLCSLVGEINKFVSDHTVITNKVSLFGNRERSWRMTGRLPPRSLDSVHLPNEADKTRLIQDLTRFYERQDTYNKMGVNCKRGYLIYGPPGTGKTSLIRAVASHFGKSLCSITLDGNVNDSIIQDLMSDVPENSIVSFEDIDRMKQSNVTLSCLLAVLDGNYAKGPQVVFLTTNNPDALDPAIRRHGRADVQLEISFSTKSQVEEAFRYIFQIQADDEKNRTVARQVADSFPEASKIAMSTVMEAFIRLMDIAPADAAKQLAWKAMLNEKGGKEEESSSGSAASNSVPSGNGKKKKK